MRHYILIHWEEGQEVTLLSKLPLPARTPPLTRKEVR